jgi:hypothetical protein
MEHFGRHLVRARPAAAARGSAGALALACAALAACASAPPPLAPARAAAGGVRTVAVLRFAEGGRADPALALGESLGARGLSVSPVDAAGGPERGRLERLRALVRTRVEGDRADRAVSSSGLGEEAAEAVRALGVDAVALSVRLPAYATMPPPAGPGGLWPAPGARVGPDFDPIAPAPPREAVAVVTAAGDVVWSGWGAQQEMLGAPGPEPLPAVTRPVNAAEAIDALVAAVTGEAPGED